MIATQIRLMTYADLPLGMRLKTANGWNQTEADWRRCLDLQPDGCFVATIDGAPVGTLTTCLFGSVAWIAMVLVDSKFRGRGIGTSLMHHALEFLKRQGVVTIRLDATPLGQPLYEKLGFVGDHALHRYEGVLPASDQLPEVEPLLPADLSEVLRLDRLATKTDRRKLLLRLANEFPKSLHTYRGQSEIEGFCGARPGALAHQIGPCIGSEAAGLRLLDHAQHQFGGERVFIDVPDQHEAAVRWTKAAGLTAQRRLLRMTRGPKLNERIAEFWVSSGPEMG